MQQPDATNAQDIPGTPEKTSEVDTQPQKEKEISLSIVCTTFPQYDWTKQILGERADHTDLTFLLSSSIDLHSYQPSVSDMVSISTCDLFIYIGGISDDWAEDALRQSVNPDMVVINLMEVLGDAVKIEEELEGLEEDHDHDHNHGHSHNHSHDHDADHDDDSNQQDGHHEIELDEHVWLSLRNAVIFCSAIADALKTLDPNNSVEYEANLAAYTEKLTALDDEYKSVLGSYDDRVLLFGDRFPFRYLADDYDIKYYAAFPGCSAETEASFQTIVFLAGKMDELDLLDIMVTESSDKSIANTIISNTLHGNQQIHVLDAMQSVTLIDVQNGVTYLTIMESNLEVLRTVSGNWG